MALLSSHSYAQELSPDAGLSYPAAYFSKFAPRTAADMINKVPGFVPREIDSARGLGQASSNILINGARSSGKQESALQSLAKVPAKAVKRIDIRDGASLGIVGLSGDVADIIIEEQQTRGNWLYRTHQRSRVEPVWWRMDVSLSGQRKALAWRANLQNRQDRFGHWGLEQLTDGTGSLLEIRDEAASYNIDRPAGSINLNWAPVSGQLANFSASYKQKDTDDDEDSLRTPSNGDQASRRLLDSVSDQWFAEINTDYSFDFMSGRLKLIAYQRLENLPRQSTTTLLDLNDTELSSDLFRRDSEVGETIGRAEYRWLNDLQHSWQLSVEGAFNYLEVDSELFAATAGGALMPVPIDNGSSKVEEARAEMNVTHSRTLGEATKLQFSIGGEFSQIKQSGAAGLSRDFFRPKGFVSISHQLSAQTLLSAKLAREVGQLDFFDFISSVNVDEQSAAAGNPELVPPQSWRFDFRLERQFGQLGDLSLSVWYEDIEDIVDRVITASGGEAEGNLDSAQRYGAQWVSTLNLDRFAWQGGRLDLNYTLQHSELDDPVTSEPRRINSDLIQRFSAEIRHDVPRSDWAWGVKYSRERHSATLQLDEIQLSQARRGDLRVFLEQKNLFGLKTSVVVRNLLDDRETFRRSVFTPLRDGDLAFTEYRSRRFGPVLEVQIEGEF